MESPFMKGDPLNPADWEKLVRADLVRARRELTANDASAAAFWLEQSVEKAIKGWLIGRGWSLVKTHDLSRLAEETRRRGLDLSASLPVLLRLSRLYFIDRYLDESSEPEPDVAEAAALFTTVGQIIEILFPSQPPPPSQPPDARAS